MVIKTNSKSKRGLNGKRITEILKKSVVLFFMIKLSIFDIIIAKICNIWYTYLDNKKGDILI